MYKYIVILIVLLVAVVLIVWISNKLTGGRKYTYEEVENQMVTSAKSYFKNIGYPSDGQSKTVTYQMLEEKGYIKSYNSYFNNNKITCLSGKVTVYNKDDTYAYVPVLNCTEGKEKHNSVELFQAILEDNDYGTTKGSGLYAMENGKVIETEKELEKAGEDTNYIFRGNEVNNYLQIGTNLFRIVSIDEYGNMLLIFNSTSKSSYPWDTRYNEEKNKNFGINNYVYNDAKSSIMQTNEQFLSGGFPLRDKEILDKGVKYLITPMDLCIGKRSINDETKDGKAECSEILEEQEVGLLPAYNFMLASLDENCKTTTSRSCGNNNYLTQFNEDYWLITAVEDNSYQAYYVKSNYIVENNCNGKVKIKNTLLLSNETYYHSGDGSLENPYKVKIVTE